LDLPPSSLFFVSLPRGGAWFPSGNPSEGARGPFVEAITSIDTLATNGSAGRHGSESEILGSLWHKDLVEGYHSMAF